MNKETIDRLANQISLDHRVVFSIAPPFDELWFIPQNRPIQDWLRSVRLYKGVSKPFIRVRIPNGDISQVQAFLRQSQTGKFYDLSTHLDYIGMLDKYEYLVDK